MIDYDYIAKENRKHNIKIFNHLWRIWIIQASGFGKTNVLFNLKKQQNGYHYTITDKTYLYVKDRNEAKYQYII